jgi:hypothetical protein
MLAIVEKINYSHSFSFPMLLFLAESCFLTGKMAKSLQRLIALGLWIAGLHPLCIGTETQECVRNVCNANENGMK